MRLRRLRTLGNGEKAEVDEEMESGIPRRVHRRPKADDAQTRDGRQGRQRTRRAEVSTIGNRGMTAEARQNAASVGERLASRPREILEG